MAERPIDLEQGRKRILRVVKFIAPWNLIEAGLIQNDLHPYKIECNLQEFVQEHVPGKHKHYDACRQLLIDYRNTKSLDSPLKIFTLDTPFCNKLTSASRKTNLSSLKEHFYQGISYRGVLITFNDAKVYEWAFENKDSYIKTTTFASTTTEKDVAIKLGKLPELNLSCISNFEDENEILLLPGAFFKVLNIEYDNKNQKLMIYLENFDPGTKSSLFA